MPNRTPLLRRAAVGAVAAVLLLSTASGAAIAQTELSNQDLLRDFIHYVRIRNDQLAASYARTLLSRGLTGEEFVGLVEDNPRTATDFDDAVRDAMVIPDTQGVAADLFTLYEKGRLDQARNPDEISRNIQLLDDNARARMLARERLAFAGEYAVPQLIQVLLARGNPLLESYVQTLLVDMGSSAVAPLSLALLHVDPTTQERLAKILGRIGSDVAVPYLFDTLSTTDAAPVRSAAAEAIARIRGDIDPSADVAALYHNLAERYYAEQRSLTRFPGEEHQLLWTYPRGVGLFPVAIRSEVYHEARAMELAERALNIDAERESTVALWLAANMSREIDSPDGYENPTWPADRPGADFFAVAAGPRTTQMVLARGLADADTPLARKALAALQMTAGGADLWQGLGESRPLLDALAYPDRRVQYDAALALGAANPAMAFPGAERVVPILASAVDGASARYAVVVSRDVDVQQRLIGLLRDAGYETLSPGASLTDAAPGIADAPGVDLIVSWLPVDESETLISTARATSKLRATPILAVLPAGGYNEVYERFANSRLTDVRRQGVSDEQITESVSQLALRAAGPAVADDEATDYARRALATLRDIAVSGSVAYSIADAARPLVEALGQTEGDVKMQVADVLAHMPLDRAQIALVEASLDADADERIALIQHAGRSVKAYGAMLPPRLVDRVVELATAASGREAVAAAALMGALNLPDVRLAPMILELE